ncbi:hypothetical protein DIPPA_29694 [Diplonema papillatum]|nr:hypothetical protein DIPPA_29694 [Diplonema papillatum]
MQKGAGGDGGEEIRVARFEVNAILSEEGWKAEDVQVRPVCALGRGTFRIEGLTEEQRWSFSSVGASTPFGSTVASQHPRRAGEATPEPDERNERKTQEGPAADTPPNPLRQLNYPRTDVPSKTNEDADPKPTNEQI